MSINSMKKKMYESYTFLRICLYYVIAKLKKINKFLIKIYLKPALFNNLNVTIRF